MNFCRNGLFFCLLAFVTMFSHQSHAAMPDQPTEVQQEASTPAQTPQSPTKTGDSKPNPDANGVYHMGLDGMTPPQIRHISDPQIPFRLQYRSWQGVVMVGLVVGIDGKPHSVYVTSTFSDTAAQQDGVAKDFDEAALQCVEKYRFKPGTYHGQPVPFVAIIQINLSAHP